jgi:hypothetical protein
VRNAALATVEVRIIVCAVDVKRYINSSATAFTAYVVPMIGAYICDLCSSIGADLVTAS